MKMKRTAKAQSKMEHNKKAEPEAVSKGKGGGKKDSTGLSQAKINVMKTMIYIVVCFAVCWMPRASYALYRKFTVTLF